METGLIRDVGFPIFMVVVILGGLAWVAKWVAANVARPMVDSHVGLITDLRESTKKTAEFIAITPKMLEEVKDTVDKKTDELKQLVLTGCPILNPMHREKLLKIVKQSAIVPIMLFMLVGCRSAEEKNGIVVLHRTLPVLHAHSVPAPGTDPAEWSRAWRNAEGLVADLDVLANGVTQTAN